MLEYLQIYNPTTAPSSIKKLFLRHCSNKSCTIMQITLKDLGTFCNTKHNVHRFTLNLHRLKIMIVESFPENISCWGAVVFEKRVKQCNENTFLQAKIIFVSWSLRRKLYSWIVNYSTSASSIFREAFYCRYL